MPKKLRAPLSVRVTPAVDPSQDYLTRAELSAIATRGASVVVNIVARGMARDIRAQRILTAAGAARPSSSITLDALDTVVDGIVSGRDISASYPTIARLIHAQDSRAEVVGQLLITQDYERLSAAVRARRHIEEALFAQALNDDLLPAERIMLLQELNEIIGTSRKHVVGQSTSVNDVAALLEKLDYTTELAGDALKKKFASTTVQGREVVRKLLLRVSKAVKGATPDE